MFTSNGQILLGMLLKINDRCSQGRNWVILREGAQVYLL